MNNQYHSFTRIPKGVVNAALFDLQRLSYTDALDVFEYLTNLTHHNAFESKMIYRNELLGIQRRLNKVLIPLGYRFKAKQVPTGIQKAHKVCSTEKRWGFEAISPRERINRIVSRSSIGQMMTEEKRLERQQKQAERYNTALNRFRDFTIDEALIQEFFDEQNSLFREVNI